MRRHLFLALLNRSANTFEMLRNYLLIFMVIAATVGCSNDKPDFASYIVDSPNGIDPNKLDLIESYPPGVKINYFPKDVIRNARVKTCKVFEIDTAKKERLSREVQFNYSGDIIKDSNFYFQDWDLGSMVGTSLIIYDTLGRKIVWKVGNVGRRSDSNATVRHYTKKGLLFEEDHYVYKRHLKKGVDPHLTFPSDHELRPSWRLDHTTSYLTVGDTLVIEKRARKKIFDTEKYLLTFDKTNRLIKKSIIREGYLFDTTVYRYENNTMTAELARRGKDNTQSFVHSMRSVLNDSGQMLRRQTVSDGSAGSETIITYNLNGTINTISKGKYLKRFEYSFY